MVSIRKSLTSGIFYTALARYSGIIISIIIGAVLARLLTPEEFGIVALVTVFVSFFNLLSDFGIGPAVIQNQTLNDNDIKSIFLFSILLGFLMAGLFYISAPVVAQFYDKSELVQVSRLLSLSILFHSLQIVPKALLQKSLRFKQIGILTLSVQTLSGIIAIYLAFAGYSYFALVFQSILSGLLSLVLFYWLAPVKIELRVKFEAIKKIIRFSSFQFMFNVINYFSRNSDNILIGKFLSPAALGYYDKSYRLMMMPVANLTHVITPVLMPVLSKYQHDHEVIYRTYLKVVKILATIGFPLSVFLFFTANEIIHIIYGPQWTESVPVFKLLAITVGLQMILSSSGSIFQAINRTDLMFLSGLLGTTVLIGSIAYGIFVGKSIISVGYGVILGYSIYFILIFYLLIKKALKKEIIHFYKIMMFPFSISVVMAIILWGFEKLIPEQIIYSLFAKALIASLSFGILFIIRKKNRVLLYQKINKYLK
jgi:PST family polysaccharide transporter